MYEAVRHISNTYQLLESKIEELMTFLRERNADLLKDISDVPVKDRDCRSDEELINLPKEEVRNKVGMRQKWLFDSMEFCMCQF